MKPALFVILAASSLSLFSACGGGAQSPPAGSPASTTGTDAAPVAKPFTVPADQMAHIKVAPARTTTWETTVRTTGTVDWDNDHTTQAITQVSGPIARLLVDTGTRVKVGDALLSVASADMAGAISTYRKAKNRFDLAQRTLDRSKDLLAHKAIAPRDMEGAQADYNDASTDLQTSLQTLKIFGVSEQDIADAEQQNVAIRPELVMRAPLAGTIVQKMVLPGQFIQAATTPCFVISDTGTVWVQGHVYDRDLGAIHVGDKVDERNSSFPQTFHGVVSYIGDMLDPATRTTPVRIVTQNIDSLLKKDIFLDVVIHDKSTQDVLVVPTPAVLYDEQNFPFVYIQTAPGQFLERRVTIGNQEDGDTQVTEGLKAGDPIVSDGSLFLQFANTYQQ
jgi:cobalt-zinc-cadmium efflux system membrane fusion protein